VIGWRHIDAAAEQRLAVDGKSRFQWGRIGKNGGQYALRRTDMLDDQDWGGKTRGQTGEQLAQGLYPTLRRADGDDPCQI